MPCIGLVEEVLDLVSEVVQWVVLLVDEIAIKFVSDVLVDIGPVIGLVLNAEELDFIRVRTSLGCKYLSSKCDIVEGFEAATIRAEHFHRLNLYQFEWMKFMVLITKYFI